MSKTCKYFGKCGGCQTPNLTYPEQLSMKMAKVISLMGRLCHVDEIVPMEDPYHYRCKVQTAFTRVGGEMMAGIYQSATGRVIPAKSCLLEDPVAAKIRNTAVKLARDMHLTVYSPKNGRGLLRHMLVRTSPKTGQALVVIVTGKSPFTKAKSFTEALVAACPSIVSVVHNVNESDIAMAMGTKSTVLYGDGYFEDEILGRRFRVSAKAFLQVNPTQTEKLYKIALDAAGLTGRESVIDAYCGVGTLGILAASHAGYVTGVELVPEAAADASVNAVLNSISNAKFVAGDAGEYMAALASRKKHADVVLLDPPRAGCDKKFLNSLIKLSPDRVVYVSCNPETLARDAKMLTHNGYRVTKITPVDMFPWTTHCEVVCVLERIETPRGKNRDL